MASPAGTTTARSSRARRRLCAEVRAYLRLVAALREYGLEPTWRSEADEVGYLPHVEELCRPKIPESVGRQASPAWRRFRYHGRPTLA
jgi:hypothetical protein